jgi:hypothetical protein
LVSFSWRLLAGWWAVAACVLAVSDSASFSTAGGVGMHNIFLAYFDCSPITYLCIQLFRASPGDGRRRGRACDPTSAPGVLGEAEEEDAAGAVALLVVHGGGDNTKISSATKKTKKKSKAKH